MRKILSLFFNCILFSCTFLVLTIGLVALPFPRQACVFVVRMWSRSILWACRVIIRLDYQVEGLEKVKIPCIIAAKHQSAWDTIVFHSLLRDPAFVLKKELDVLSFGWYIRRLKMIIVDRKDGRKSIVSLIQQGQRIVNEGKRPLVIFPEGTRTALDEKVKYQKGVAALYKNLHIPVIPVALNSGCFWGRRSFDKKPGTIRMKFLDPIEPGLKVDTFLEKLTTDLEAETAALSSYPVVTAHKQD